MIKSPPTPQELQAAWGKTVADVIAPNLSVLFCGINPGLYSGVVGHHFARPGNRFWITMYRSGFTPRLLAPEEEKELLQYGYGITNIVNRATATAQDLTSLELAKGGRKLQAKVRKYQPHYLAVLGVSAFCHAFHCPKAKIGLQPERINQSHVWVLPNPSGLNANYQLPDFVRLFRNLRCATFNFRIQKN